jgi:hypothetical protein
VIAPGPTSDRDACHSGGNPRVEKVEDRRQRAGPKMCSLLEPTNFSANPEFTERLYGK